MITQPQYFKISEFVCEHVWDIYAQNAWMFFDTKLLVTMETIRDRIGKPIIINNWQIHGNYSQRGLRCLRCDLVKAKIEAGEMYMSAHLLGKACDFEVEGLLAEEIRLWIVANAKWWPYHIRLERDVSWIHLDTFDQSDQKVYLFNK